MKAGTPPSNIAPGGRKTTPPEQPTQPLRIIGGRWRGRKLAFPAIDGLRPTGNRIRETLFNWVGPYVAGARCLDLYAGSGALGLEALSRGAGYALLIEKDPAAASQLGANLAQLDCHTASALNADSLALLEKGPREGPFDLVFIDPPFQQDLWQASIDRLIEHRWLVPEAVIYLESAPDTRIAVPEAWRLHRDKTSGQVRYRLYFAD